MKCRLLLIDREECFLSELHSDWTLIGCTRSLHQTFNHHKQIFGQGSEGQCALQDVFLYVETHICVVQIPSPASILNVNHSDDEADSASYRGLTNCGLKHRSDFVLLSLFAHRVLDPIKTSQTSRP